MQLRPLRRVLPLAWVLLGVVAFFAGADAQAAAEEKRFGQEVLEILRDEGRIDDERYEELRKLEQAEYEATQQSASANPEAFSVTYKNGLNFKRNDGQVKIKLGGRIQADFASIHVDSDLTNALDFGDTPPNAPTPIGGDGEGVELRRTRLYVSGDLYDRIVFKSQFDFAGGDVSLKDQYIGMKKIPYVGTIQVGHMKEPFSLEELASSKHITFMERSLPTLFDSERNFGIVAMNDVLDQRLTYAFGGFAPSDDQGNYFSNDSDVNITGRITGLPYLEDESRYLHLGLGFSYQFRSGSEIRYAQRPESHLAKKYLDTGDVESHGNAVVGGEIAWVQGPLSIQSEIKSSWLKTSSSGSRANAWGGYGEIGYFLTGEHRAYKKKSAIFTRVNPTNPFDPAQGKWGAWEVAARYSYLDLNDGNHGLKGGRQQDITLGINWHLYSNVKLMTNYVHAIVMDTGTKNGSERGHANIFQMRAQIEF